MQSPNARKSGGLRPFCPSHQGLVTRSPSGTGRREWRGKGGSPNLCFWWCCRLPDCPVCQGICKDRAAKSTDGAKAAADGVFGDYAAASSMTWRWNESSFEVLPEAADNAFSRDLRSRHACRGQRGMPASSLLPALLAAAAAHAASAPLDFTVVIPRVMALEMRGHPALVRVTAEDVARGEVVVQGAQLDITANGRAGFVLRAELNDAAFGGVAIDGLPAALACDCTAAHASMRAPGHRLSARVRYRLRLADHATPGEYRWPVTLSLQEP